MAGSTIRKALGAVKDQTSISIAKVSSNLAPEIDVAIVKATSHEDEPANEKYLREILSLTAYNRLNVSACISSVSRRLGKTRDWIVAVKTLMLVHRLLTDGDRGFQEEILYATRRGTRLLNMADFRDEAHSSSWDHSAFVRTYALYLDQRLECVLFERKQKKNEDGSRDERERVRDRERERGYYSDEDYDRRRDMRREDGDKDKKPETPVRLMKIERVLGRIQQLQKLLDRFLSCRPTGKAKSSRMILVALYPIVRESFQLYADICEIMSVLVDWFPDLEYNDCKKAFDAYATAAKQIDELIAFYDWAKDIGLARSSEYPQVQKITDKLLETLEEFMRDKAGVIKSPDSDRGRSMKAEKVSEEEEPVQDMNEIKALPAPEGFVPKESSHPKIVKKVEVQQKQQKQQQQQQQQQQKQQEEKKHQPPQAAVFVDLREESVTADEQGNKLALCLFSTGGSSTTVKTDGAWEAFGSDSAEPEVTSAWQTPAAETGKAEWELALVETASNLSKQKATMAGGFDSLLLDGMYDQGAVKQHVNAQTAGGSSSSVAMPMPGNTTKILALPAPDGTMKTIGNEDPFAASLIVPPPSYVQMAEIEKKQQLVVQEQLMWQQYQMNGMQGAVSLAKLSMNNSVGQPMPYGMPPYNGGGYYTAPY